MHLEYPLEAERIKYKEIHVFKSREKERYVFIGHHPLVDRYGIMYINIQKGTELYLRSLKSLVFEEDRQFESMEEARQFLQQSHRDLAFQFICKGMIGFIKFLQGYYAILFKATEPTAKLGKHKIFAPEQIMMLELFEPYQQYSAQDEKYKKLMMEDDLEIGYYSSYTYDVTSTLAKNILGTKPQVDEDPHFYNIGTFQNKFLWNHFELEEIDQILTNKRWILPLIYGYCEQSTIKTYGNFFSICIIARRSIFHAGARYLTRGINERGYVANYVETEQIVIELDKSIAQRPACSSFVQIRGSAPVYWYQEPKLYIAKPPIKIHYSDPYLMATKKNIRDLISSYGKQLFMVNLVKTNEHHPRESILAEEYLASINTIKEELHNNTSDIDMGYLHFDMKAQLKADKEEFVTKCYSLAYYCIMKTGVFLLVSEPKQKENIVLEIQNGVVRSNCIDCLDRTNTFQQLIGEMALAIQLAKINGTSLKFNLLEMNEKVYQEFREMYEQLGDFISLQYGSSLAHRQNIGHSSKRFEIITSLKRHLKNNVSDQNKQHYIDVFLGHHRPSPEEPFIWETTTHITLFPDTHYLNMFLDDKDWWSKPYQEFLNKSFIEELSNKCKERAQFQLKQRSDGTVKRTVKKMTTFNFDIIERMTQKSSNNKIKNQNKFRFIITAPNVEIREKINHKLLTSIEDQIAKAYNDIIFLDQEEPQKENTLETPVFQTQASQSIHVSPKVKKHSHTDPEDILVFEEYLREKSSDELYEQANEIRKYLPSDLTEEEDRQLHYDLNEYLYGGIKQCQMKEFQKHDSIVEEKKIIMHTSQELKSSIVQSEMPNQVNGSISVHQPKKITVEQKTIKFLESLLKKNQSSSQRLKINKI